MKKKPGRFQLALHARAVEREEKKRIKGGTVTLLAGYRSMVLFETKKMRKIGLSACFPAAERATSLPFHVLNVINEVINIHLGGLWR
jgi:hypothetical protein